MNKGTAILGFVLCFLAGVGLMYGLERKGGVSLDAEKRAEKGAFDHSQAVVPITTDDPAWGNPDAPVTIVEISDFQCPFCSRVNATIKQIKETYGKDKVRIVWKHNPLPFHNKARPAHEAAQTVFALAGADAFWKFHDSLFGNQSNLDPGNFEKWAVSAGVDGAKFTEAFKAKKYASKVDADLALGGKIGVSGTPAFRINGVTLSGAQPFEKFKQVIDDQLKEAEKLVAAGTPKNQVYVKLAEKNAKNAPQAQKQERAPTPDDTTRWQVPVYDDDPQQGPKDALVTIVEFSEFQCPFCKRVLDTLKKVEETYGRDVRIVWKDNPLSFHPRAMPAAELARVAMEEKGNDAFWKVHAALFESQPKLEDADLQKIAKDAGVSWDKVKKAIEKKKYSDKIDQSVQLADDFKAQGTPHFFVNGLRLRGAVPFEKFKELIDKEIAEAKKLMASGTVRSEVFKTLMKTAKAAEAAETKDAPPVPKDAPMRGAKNAKVVIQEFSDFQCPFCKRVGPTIEAIEKEFGKDVQIVWRHMPLSFHKQAPLASEAAQEAYAQKGDAAFWSYHDKLFASQSEPGGLERPNLEKIAGELGLDMAKFKQALDTNKHKSKVDADMAAAQKVGISGTPAFLINDYYLSGAQPPAAFKKLIALALKAKK